MTTIDHDRGAYAPQTDGPLTFDARTPRHGRPVPFTLIFSAVVLAALIVAVVLFYRGGVREAGEAPRTIGQPVTAMKETPAPEVRPADEAEAMDVYVEKGEAAESVEAAPAFAPPPEQPQPRPAPRPAPPPVQVAEAPVSRPAAPPPAAAAAPLRPAQPTPGAAPTRSAAAPSPAPAAAPTAPAAPVSVASAGGSRYGVQIGAFSSQDIADAEFAKVAGAHAAAAGKPKSVTPVERNGSTLYRTIVGGFSKAQADALCAELKAAGGQCLVKATS